MEKKTKQVLAVGGIGVLALIAIKSMGSGDSDDSSLMDGVPGNGSTGSGGFWDNISKLQQQTLPQNILPVYIPFAEPSLLDTPGVLDTPTPTADTGDTGVNDFSFFNAAKDLLASNTGSLATAGSSAAIAFTSNPLALALGLGGKAATMGASAGVKYASKLSGTPLLVSPSKSSSPGGATIGLNSITTEKAPAVLGGTKSSGGSGTGSARVVSTKTAEGQSAMSKANVVTINKNQFGKSTGTVTIR